MSNWMIYNNTAYISGDTGKYDSKVNNASVRYGRNSADNHLNYLASFSKPRLECDRFDLNNENKNETLEEKTTRFDKNIDSIENLIQKLDEEEKRTSPINYSRKYMPQIGQNGEIDKLALLGDSYEELGATSVSTDDLENKISENNKGMPQISIDSLDINQDGKIDIGEYSTSILLCDALDNDKGEIDGIITNKGENRLIEFQTEENKDISYQIYSSLYGLYNLGQAQKEFLADPNNIVK